MESFERIFSQNRFVSFSTIVAAVVWTILCVSTNERHNFFSSFQVFSKEDRKLLRSRYFLLNYVIFWRMLRLHKAVDEFGCVVSRQCVLCVLISLGIDIVGIEK